MRSCVEDTKPFAALSRIDPMPASKVGCTKVGGNGSVLKSSVMLRLPLFNVMSISPSTVSAFTTVRLELWTTTREFNLPVNSAANVSNEAFALCRSVEPLAAR